ncbi:MAG: hypothetical protein WC527_06295 [Candidatus Margulisiibacteriota bacterium]
MLAWISSIIINFVSGKPIVLSSKKLDRETILCINSRVMHLVEPVYGCEKVLYLRNKLLGNKKIKYIRRKIFGSRRHTVGQILKMTGADGEFSLSTLC